MTTKQIAQHSDGVMEASCYVEAIYPSNTIRGIDLCIKGWGGIAHVWCDEFKSREVCQANAARLEAAWNSIDGIPTPELEAGVVKELIAAAENVLSDWTNVKSRDRLRAVLARMNTKE